MTPQPGLQAIAVHILTNISRRKGSQAIKFSGKTIRRSLSEKSTRLQYVLFICCSKLNIHT